jgi:hypothetical protein
MRLAEILAQLFDAMACRIILVMITSRRLTVAAVESAFLEPVKGIVMMSRFQHQPSLNIAGMVDQIAAGIEQVFFPPRLGRSP